MRALMNRLYKAFPDRHIYFFSYDWRLSSEENAKKLKAFVDSLPSPKVDLVAHSMGGLVAAEFFRTQPQRVGSLITLATPYEGAPEMLKRVQDPVLNVNMEPFDSLFTWWGALAPQVKKSYRSTAELAPSREYVAAVPMRSGSHDLQVKDMSYEDYFTCCAEIYGSEDRKAHV